MNLKIYDKYEKNYNNFLSPEPNGKGYIKLVVDFFFQIRKKCKLLVTSVLKFLLRLFPSTVEVGGG